MIFITHNLKSLSVYSNYLVEVLLNIFTLPIFYVFDFFFVEKCLCFYGQDFVRKSSNNKGKEGLSFTSVPDSLEYAKICAEIWSMELNICLLSFLLTTM